MYKSIKYLLLILTIVFSCQANAKKNKAQEARSKNLAAITIFVDVGGFGKRDKAAEKMTLLHQQFAKYKYQLISVEPYIEDGDLEGFFVSYVSYKEDKKLTSTPKIF